MTVELDTQWKLRQEKKKERKMAKGEQKLVTPELTEPISRQEVSAAEVKTEDTLAVVSENEIKLL